MPMHRVFRPRCVCSARSVAPAAEPAVDVSLGRLCGRRALVLIAVTLLGVSGNGLAEDAASTPASVLRDYSPAPSLVCDVGHDLTAFDVAPNGDLLAIARGRGELELRQGRSGELIAQRHPHSSTITWLGFAPGGRRLASCSTDRQLCLWDVGAGGAIELKRTIRSQGWLLSGCWFAEGQQLAVAGHDGSLAVINAASGDELWRHTLTSPVVSLSVSNAAGVLAAATRSGVLTGFAIQGGARRWSVKLSSGPLAALTTGNEPTDGAAGGTCRTFHAMSSYGMLVTVSAIDGTRVGALDLRAAIRDLSVAPWSLWSPPAQPNHQSLLAAGDARGGLTLVRTKAREIFQELPSQHAPVVGVGGSVDGDLLFSATADGRVWRWTAREPAESPLARLPIPDARIWDVALAGDDDHVFVGGRNGHVSQWDLSTGRQLAVFSGREQTVDTLAVSPDAHLVAAGGWNSTSIHLWDVSSTKLLRTLTVGSDVRDLAFSPRGTRFAAACSTGEVLVWQLDVEHPAESLKTPESLAVDQLPAYGVAFSPDGEYLAACSGDWRVETAGRVVLWNAQTLQQLCEFRVHQRAVREVCFDAAGRQLASIGHDGVVWFYDVASRTPIESITFGEGARAGRFVLHESVALKNAATAEQRDPLRRWLAVGDLEDSISVWDNHERRVVRRFRAEDDVFGVQFSRDGSLLIAADGSRGIALWRVGGGAQSLADQVAQWRVASATDSSEDPLQQEAPLPEQDHLP